MEGEKQYFYPRTTLPHPTASEEVQASSGMGSAEWVELGPFLSQTIACCGLRPVSELWSKYVSLWGWGIDTVGDLKGSLCPWLGIEGTWEVGLHSEEALYPDTL